MTTSQKNNFSVRPLGKYGQTYILNKQAYWLYQIVTATIWVLIIALWVLKYLIPSSTLSALPLGSPLNMIIPICIFGLGFQFFFASRSGKISVFTEEELHHVNTQLDKKYLHKILRLFSLGFSFLLLIAIVDLAAFDLITNHPIPRLLPIFLIPSLGIPLYFLKRDTDR